MATKQDILEQLVEEYLIHQGYFVQHNIKYRPDKHRPDYDSKKDSNYSDIDVIGFHPSRSDKKKVLAVSCKSWQNGLNPNYWKNKIEKDEKVGGKDAWKTFRELANEKWSEAFVMKVREVTGEKNFTHVTAVTRLNGEKEIWENHKPFQEALDGIPVEILTLQKMVKQIQKNLTTTLARTEVGRLLQVFLAAKIKL